MIPWTGPMVLVVKLTLDQLHLPRHPRTNQQNRRALTIPVHHLKPTFTKPILTSRLAPQMLTATALRLPTAPHVAFIRSASAGSPIWERLERCNVLPLDETERCLNGILAKIFLEPDRFPQYYYMCMLSSRHQCRGLGQLHRSRTFYQHCWTH
jgi:hypothetical protein